MSKKSRRQRTLNLPPEAFSNPQLASASAAAPGRGNQPAAKTAAPEINWKAEYGDVVGDIKRTGILAAVLLAAMVVLSFIIR